MSSYSGSITEMYISEGSYVNEGDLVAHIKSTDIDMQHLLPQRHRPQCGVCGLL